MNITNNMIHILRVNKKRSNIFILLYSIPKNKLKFKHFMKYNHSLYSRRSKLKCHFNTNCSTYFMILIYDGQISFLFCLTLHSVAHKKTKQSIILLPLKITVTHSNMFTVSLWSKSQDANMWATLYRVTFLNPIIRPVVGLLCCL